MHIVVNKNLEWSAQVKWPETGSDSPRPDSLNTFEGCDTQVGLDVEHIPRLLDGLN